MTRTDAQLASEAKEILAAGLAAAAPGIAVRRALAPSATILRARDLSGREVEVTLPTGASTWLVGAGKASAAMAAAVVELLGERICGGLVVVKDGHQVPCGVVEVVTAGHPEPDVRSLDTARRLLELVGKRRTGELVIAVISGGGSALLALPVAGLSLADKQRVTTALLRAGATIQELNQVRTALSAIKGGGLWRAGGGATWLSLVISDVVGDELAEVASGPTVPLEPDRRVARAVLERRGLWTDAPEAVRRLLASPAYRRAGPSVSQPHNLLIANNTTCLAACAERARALGYRIRLSPIPVTGEARERGRELAARVLATRDGATPCCWISGGETTVEVRGPGRGGRNQELALAAALELAGARHVVLLSAGTDGTDHLAEAAGAIAFGNSVARARAAGLDAEDCLRRNDSFHFFAALGDLVVTGPTLTNVMDVQLVLSD